MHAGRKEGKEGNPMQKKSKARAQHHRRCPLLLGNVQIDRSHPQVWGTTGDPRASETLRQPSSPKGDLFLVEARLWTFPRREGLDASLQPAACSMHHPARLARRRKGICRASGGAYCRHRGRVSIFRFSKQRNGPRTQGEDEMGLRIFQTHN
jgi:hypothetical protein